MSDNLCDEDIRREFNEKNIIEMITEVTIYWPILGYHLNIPRHKLQEFQLQYPHSLTQIKIALVAHWIDNDLDASWRKLADALDHCDHRCLAERIRKKNIRCGYNRTHSPPRSRTPSPRATRFNTSSFPTFLPPLPPPPRLLHPPSAIVRQPSSIQNTHIIVENNSHSGQEDSIGMTILRYIFCGSNKYHDSGDITKDKKRRYVEKLQESPAPDKMLHYLLHGHLDPFYVGEGGRTILHYAAIHCSLESLKTLIVFRGPDLSPLSEEGTPLDTTGINIHGGGEIKSLLKSVGAKSYSELLLKPTLPLPQSHVTDFPTIEGSRVLAMEGKGLSAILHIDTLQQLERESGRKVFEIFDWITATGLSGLFLLLMIYGHQTLADTRRLYFKLRSEMFHQRVSSRAFETFLKSYLAPEIKMNSRQKPKIILPVVHKIPSGAMETVFFNNCTKDRLSDIPVWKVAHYMCSSLPGVPLLDGYYHKENQEALLHHGVLRIHQLCSSERDREHRVTKILRLKQGQHPQFSYPIIKEENAHGDASSLIFNPHLTCSLSSSSSSSSSTSTSSSSSINPDDSQLIDCIIAAMQQTSQTVSKLVKFLS